MGAFLLVISHGHDKVNMSFVFFGGQFFPSVALPLVLIWEVLLAPYLPYTCCILI